ncbi:MAG: transglutaminase family protein [Phycisphaera sp.]|nr:MAG: transglutaminase family protein [Phycisphaera sp.]
MLRTTRFVALAAASLALAGSVLAQSSVLRQGDSKDWTIRFRANIRAWQDFGNQQQERGASHDLWEFEQATIVVPMLERTSLSRSNDSKMTMEVRVNDRDAVPARTDPYVRLNNKHAGSRYLGWAVAKGSARDIEVVTQQAMTSYDVTVDDDRALRVEWPAGDWPDDALSALDPQVGIEFGLDGNPYDGLDRTADRIDTLIGRLGRSPRDVSPYLVAKYLTGAVWGHIRSRDGTGLNTSRTGEIEGVDIAGVPTTFVRRRGNQYETCALLVYTMRRAGLPARMVMGFVADSDGDGEDELTGDRDREGEPICWVEFALVEGGRTTWIPVDLNGMMRSSSRAPNIADLETLQKPWDGFGTIDDSKYWVPFAFHVHPPITVKAYGSPGFWGIFATPTEPSRAEQMIMIDVTTTPVTAETRREKKAEESGNDRPRRRRR